MSVKTAKKLLDYIRSNQTLRNQYNPRDLRHAATLSKFARRSGFDVSEDDIRQAMQDYTDMKPPVMSQPASTAR